jgi:hypothetical protein
VNSPCGTNKKGALKTIQSIAISKKTKIPLIYYKWGNFVKRLVTLPVAFIFAILLATSKNLI